MPRIDPLSLLRCLSVLLGPTGGIKSKEEVHRLANLMTKFSKKLVSKCIYIQILKTTNTDLLSQFMTAGGWNLIHMWLTDGILAKNWALIQELLELLLLCPVDIERLKSNNCPKLIKGLSKEGSHQGVRILASRLVEQWLKIVKGEAAPNSVPAQIVAIPVQTNATQGLIIQTTQQPPQQQQYSITGALQKEDGESVTVQVQDLQFSESPPSTVSTTQLQQQSDESQQQIQEKQTIQLQVVTKPQQAQQQTSQLIAKKQSFVVVTSQSAVPLYKITIRDGKQVLTKVETDASNINNVLMSNSTPIEVNGDITDAVSSVKEDADKTRIESSEGVYSERGEVTEVQLEQQSDQVSSEVKQSSISSKDNSEIGTNNVKSTDNKDNKDSVISDSNKSSDKENRDSHKKDDKKASSALDKKSSSHHHGSSSSSKSSKHSSTSSHRSSSSSSHRSSSHRSSSSSSRSSRDKSSKDKHHSSSKHSSSKSKSDKEKEREREKEKQKKDQAEKDKATLEKVQGQVLSSKVGKIPKKKLEDSSRSGDVAKKSPTESRDSSKENKDKTEARKTTAVPEKKNISISIESRKNTQDATARPKTVKTFNSKFRSTGLEEEVKPPPPRSAKKPAPVEKKIVPLPKLPVLKRPSPLREVVAPSEKRAKLSMDSPSTPPTDEKKGGIKLIPPKPKQDSVLLQKNREFCCVVLCVLCICIHISILADVLRFGAKFLCIVVSDHFLLIKFSFTHCLISK